MIKPSWFGRQVSRRVLQTRSWVQTGEPKGPLPPWEALSAALDAGQGFSHTVRAPGPG